jgi:hypothetical protein
VEVGLHLVLIPGIGVHDVPAAGLVVRADDEGLLVLVLVVLGIGGGIGIGIGGALLEGLGVRRFDDVGRFRGGDVDDHRLDVVVGGRLVTDGGSGSVLGHSHTDQGLNSQRTPFAKA